MRTSFHSLRFSFLLLPALLGLASAPASAQKVQSETLKATFYKTPIVALKPQYATYSVDYDLGGQAMSNVAQPVLQGLTYQKTGGDLLLHFTAKSLYISDRKLVELPADGLYGYAVSYTADLGYELRDTKTDQVLYSYRRTSGVVNTQYYKSVRNLNSYLDNGFINEQGPQMLRDLQRRADFVLNPHQYPVELSLNTVSGEAPAYAAISQATADCKALMAAGTAPDPARLAALTSTWQQHLARVNWEDKKSEINKKVAAALLENLCAAALLANDYTGLAGYVDSYVSHRGSTFGLPVQFKTDMTYTGTAFAPGTATFMGRDLNKTLRASYADLAADMRPGK